MYFLTFVSNICILNIGLEYSAVKTGNLGAVNLVLSCFLRSRRTWLSILNASVKSWYYKSFGKILMNMFSKSSLCFPRQIRKPPRGTSRRVRSVLWLWPSGSSVSTLGDVLSSSSLSAAVTWWVTKEAGSGDEDGEKGVSLKFKCSNPL